LPPFALLPPSPSSSTLFPYTTLFRSSVSPDSVTIPVFGHLLHGIAPWLADGGEALGVISGGVDQHLRGAAGGVLLDATRYDAKRDRKSTRLNSSHEWSSYAVFCL